MSFVRAPNPIWYLPDLIGQPLNDEYYAFFLTNTLPYLPQNVYRDNQGMTVWTNDVVQFFPNGTLPDNLYFDPNLVYRIEIRHGNSQSDQLIYEINDFVPGTATPTITNPLSILFAENQVSNGNFGQVDFTNTLLSTEPTLTISTAGTYQIAPGWDLVLTGVGTTTLIQRIYDGAGINTSPNAINYALEIANAGWTTAILRQRFEGNGAIFGGGAVNMSMLARGVSGGVTVSMIYMPSNGTATTVVAPTVVNVGNYVVVSGTVNLPASDNTDLSNVAYVDMVINLPTTGTLDVTDMQMVGQNDPIPGSIPLTSVNPEYQQETEERRVDHLFHYYADDLITKPKKNILVGWNFPLNPYQFIDPTIATVAAQTAYIADQTILHQEAASQLQTGKNVVAQRGNLLVKAVTAQTTTRFALIQYIDPKSIAPFWSYVLSAFARARIVTSHSTQVRLKMRLIYRTSLPSAIGAAEPIAGWAPNSDPTFSAGWSSIAPLNDPAYILPNSYVTGSSTNEYPSFSFDQFQMPDSSNADMTLGIVVYTMDNLNATAASEDSIEFDRISLIHSDFGADANAQTFDEVLRECQYYYETSYDYGTPIGTAPATPSSLAIYQNSTTDGGGTNLWGSAFDVNYRVVKRAVPSTFNVYSNISGSVNTMEGYLSGVDGGPSFWVDDAPINISNYTVLSNGTRNISYFNSNGTVLRTTAHPNTTNPNGWIQFHYTADARLGV